MDNLEHIPLIRMERGEFAVLVSKLDNLSEELSDLRIKTMRLGLSQGLETISSCSLNRANTDNNNTTATSGNPQVTKDFTRNLCVDSDAVSSDNEGWIIQTRKRKSRPSPQDKISDREGLLRRVKMRDNGKGHWGDTDTDGDLGRGSGFEVRDGGAGRAGVSGTKGGAVDESLEVRGGGSRSGGEIAMDVVQADVIVRGNGGAGRGLQTEMSQSYSATVRSGLNVSAAHQQSTANRRKMVGNAHSVSGKYVKVKAAKPIIKKAIYALYNVSIDETVKSLTDCIQTDLNITVLSCFETNTLDEFRSRKSFRLCIDASDSASLLNPEYWASGIIIKEWRFSTEKRSGPTRSSFSAAKHVSGAVPPTVPHSRAAVADADSNPSRTTAVASRTVEAVNASAETAAMGAVRTNNEPLLVEAQVHSAQHDATSGESLDASNNHSAISVTNDSDCRVITDQDTSTQIQTNLSAVNNQLIV